MFCYFIWFINYGVWYEMKEGYEIIMIYIFIFKFVICFWSRIIFGYIDIKVLINYFIFF